MRAVVTGANGHLGSTLCNALSQHGIDLVVCVRSPHDTSRTEHLPKSARICDYSLADIGSLERAFAGSDLVFHTAAPTSLWAKDAADLSTPIYEGTLNVIRAAAKARVRKIIYTSSCAAVGFHAGANAHLDENNLNDATTQPQFAAKLRSERDGATLANSLGVEFIRVCPPSVLGPGFLTATPSTAPYVLLASGKLHAIPDLSYAIVDVRDLALAQILLATNTAAYNRYIIAGTFVTTQQLLKVIAAAAPGAMLPRLVLPSWSLPALAALDAAAYYLSFKKRRRALTLELARECMGANQRVSDQRFRSEFHQWSPRSLQTTISDTLSWIKEHNA